MSGPTPTPLTVERLEAHLDAMGWDRPRAMAEDLAPLVAEHMVDAVAAARADERERVAPLVRRAVLDPGAFVKRGPDYEGEPYGERLDQWQARAIRAAIDPRNPPGSPDDTET